MLEIKNLSVDFGTFSLKNINLSLPKGAIMGFVGQNGSGKTTTLKSILNVFKLSSGEIKILGKDSIKDEVFVKNLIGYVPAESYLIPGRTIDEHKEVFKDFYDEFDFEIYKSCLKKWKLNYTMTERELSTGMKTKAMLALTLAHKPKLLILDEPTAGLDPVARLELLEDLREFVKDEDRSIIIATHITSDLDKIADYITIVHDGRILESLSIDEVQSKYCLVKGNASLIDENRDKLIGYKVFGDSFEGIALRTELGNLKRSVPNIEDILTYFIIGGGV
ncbi:MAG: ABC transporter ATP-binding protein [Clostridium sp.]